MSDDVDDFLEHHGIKGMHWGVRKADKSGPGGLGSVVKKQFINGQIATGASWAGSFVGAAAGSAVLGSSGKTVGKVIGGYAGGYAVNKIQGSRKKKELASYGPDLKGLIPDRHKNYTSDMVKSDVKKFDVDGVQRIDRDMKAGLTRNNALKNETRLQQKARYIGFGTSFATYALKSSGSRKVRELKADKGPKMYDWAAKNGPGARRAAGNAPNASQIATKTFAKKNRKGVYNISSL